MAEELDNIDEDGQRSVAADVFADFLAENESEMVSTSEKAKVDLEKVELKMKALEEVLKDFKEFELKIDNDTVSSVDALVGKLTELGVEQSSTLKGAFDSLRAEYTTIDALIEKASVSFSAEKVLMLKERLFSDERFVARIGELFNVIKVNGIEGVSFVVNELKTKESELSQQLVGVRAAIGELYGGEIGVATDIDPDSLEVRRAVFEGRLLENLMTMMQRASFGSDRDSSGGKRRFEYAEKVVVPAIVEIVADDFIKASEDQDSCLDECDFDFFWRQYKNWKGNDEGFRKHKIMKAAQFLFLSMFDKGYTTNRVETYFGGTLAEMAVLAGHERWNDKMKKEEKDYEGSPLKCIKELYEHEPELIARLQVILDARNQVSTSRQGEKVLKFIQKGSGGLASSEGLAYVPKHEEIMVDSFRELKDLLEKKAVVSDASSVPVLSIGGLNKRLVSVQMETVHKNQAEIGDLSKRLSDVQVEASFKNQTLGRKIEELKGEKERLGAENVGLGKVVEERRDMLQEVRREYDALGADYLRVDKAGDALLKKIEREIERKNVEIHNLTLDGFGIVGKGAKRKKDVEKLKIEIEALKRLLGGK